MTQDEIIEMAKKAGISICGNWAEQELEAFAKLVAAKEREACLSIADDCADADMHASLAANAIRARGEA